MSIARGSNNSFLFLLGRRRYYSDKYPQSDSALNKKALVFASNYLQAKEDGTRILHFQTSGNLVRFTSSLCPYHSCSCHLVETQKDREAIEATGDQRNFLYKLLHGDVKEIKRCSREACSKTMTLDH
jgi:hypothetical protein